jgi:hypothetical protein
MDPKHVALIELFEVLGVNEKGIEKVYSYLLEFGSIGDIKELSPKLDLPVKRIYKIVNVLKEDLGFIQIYDRPMKIQLLSPVETISAAIEKKKKSIQQETQKKIQNCDQVMETIFDKFDFLEKENMGNVVEFITPSTDNNNSMVNFMLNTVTGKRGTKIAKYVMYSTDLLSKIENANNTSEFSQIFRANAEKIFSKSPNMHIELLVSKEYIEEAVPDLISLTKLNKYLDSIALNVNIEVRVTSEDFSNFSIRDEKVLIQPSFTPNKQILGYYMTTNNEIVRIMAQKFSELYDNSIEVDEYIKQYGVSNLVKLPNSLRILFTLI